MVLLLLLSGCSDHRPMRPGFSLAPDARAVVLASPPNDAKVRLEKTRSFGDIQKRGFEIFGFVSDAAFRTEDTVFVVDSNLQRVVVFDGKGRVAKTFSAQGRGPGEFVSPTTIEVGETHLTIHDTKLNRLTVFNRQWEYQNSVPVSSVGPVWLASAPGGVLLTVSAPGTRRRLLHYDFSRKEVSPIASPPERESEAPPKYLPEPGRTCRLDDDEILYANSWTYELVVLEWPSGTPVRRYLGPDRALSPRRQDANGTFVQGAAVLGLSCTDRYIVFSYIEESRTSVFYDIYSTDDMRPLGRLEFDASKHPERVPGFVADGSEDLILTFKSRPFPQAAVYRIVPTE